MENATQPQLNKILYMIEGNESKTINAIYEYQIKNNNPELFKIANDRSLNLGRKLEASNLSKIDASKMIKLLYGRDSHIRKWKEQLIDMCYEKNIIPDYLKEQIEAQRKTNNNLITNN